MVHHSKDSQVYCPALEKLTSSATDPSHKYYCPSACHVRWQHFLMHGQSSPNISDCKSNIICKHLQGPSSGNPFLPWHQYVGALLFLQVVVQSPNYLLNFILLVYQLQSCWTQPLNLEIRPFPRGLPGFPCQIFIEAETLDGHQQTISASHKKPSKQEAEAEAFQEGRSQKTSADIKEMCLTYLSISLTQF